MTHPKTPKRLTKKGPGLVGLDPTSILTSSAGFPLGHPERDKIDK